MRIIWYSKADTKVSLLSHLRDCPWPSLAKLAHGASLVLMAALA